jgi:hypothetical protein
MCCPSLITKYSSLVCKWHGESNLNHHLPSANSLPHRINPLLDRLQALTDDHGIWLWLQRPIGQGLGDPGVDGLVGLAAVEVGDEDCDWNVS